MVHEMPSISVELVGPSRQRTDGAREQDYIDEHGAHWTCVTNEVARRWVQTNRLVRKARGA